MEGGRFAQCTYTFSDGTGCRALPQKGERCSNHRKTIGFQPCLEYATCQAFTRSKVNLCLACRSHTARRRYREATAARKQADAAASAEAMDAFIAELLA